jgi:hypothetical protein
MRKITIGIITVLLALALLGVLVAGCGTAAADKTDTTAAAAGTATTAAATGTTAAAATETTAVAASEPAAILNNAVTAAKPMPNVTGTFDLSLAVNGDTSKMPAQTAAMFSQPITISGTVSASESPLAADVAIKAAFAGQNIPLGFKAAGGKAWIEFMNVWYEAPAELMSAMSSAGSTSTTINQADIMQQLKAAGLDPSTWVKDLKLVGEEDIDGTKAYHLSGSVDIAKLITDASKASQDGSLQGLIPGASTGTSVTLPSATDLSTITNEVGAMFKSTTIDLWITKDGNQLRKAAVNAQIVPPAGQDAQGITDMTLKATVTMAPATGALNITAPTDVKPWADLQQALGGLSSLFGGALGGTTDTSSEGTLDTTVQ